MVAVIGTPDERMGEVGKAFIVKRPGEESDEKGMIEWARANMANYKVPKKVLFVDETAAQCVWQSAQNRIA